MQGCEKSGTVVTHQHGLREHSVFGGGSAGQQAPHCHIEQQAEWLVKGGSACRGETR